MARFLVDVNLPYYFGLWNNSDFEFVKDICDKWTDQFIWQYALEHKLVILTKDSDFSIKALYYGAPPKVIHFRIGNMKIKEFHSLIERIWHEVERLISENSIVNIYPDRLECIE